MYEEKRENIIELLRLDTEPIDSNNKSIDGNQNYPVNWADHAQRLKDKGKYKEALASYDKGVALNPNNADWEVRAELLSYLGQWKEVITSYDHAIAEGSS